MSTCKYRLSGGTFVQPNSPGFNQVFRKLAVNREEAARMLSVCTKTLDRLTSCGSIRSVKVFRRRIFSVEELTSWLGRRASVLTPPTPSPDSGLPLTATRYQAADLLSLGVRLFDQIVASGEIPKIQITRKQIFRTSDLVGWLREKSFLKI